MTNFGIDIGTINTKIGYIDKGLVKILLNSDSERVFKSYILLDKPRVFANSAYIRKNNKNIITNFTNITLTNNYQYFIMFVNYLYNYFKLNNIEPKNITIATPTSYLKKDKDIVKQVFNKYGANIIPKSIAIGLSYGYYKKNSDYFNNDSGSNIIFIDLGEKFSELSLINFKKESFKVLNNLDLNLTGEYIKEEVYKSVINKYKIYELLDKDRIKLYNDISDCIVKLSVNKLVTRNIENIFEKDTFSYTVYQDELNEILKPLMNGLNGQIKELLSKSNLNKKNIDSICYIGGISRIPYLQRNSYDGIKIKNNLNADECIANGCTIYSGLYSSKINEPNYKVSLINKESVFIAYDDKKYTLFSENDFISSSKRVRIDYPKDKIISIIFGENVIKYKLNNEDEPPVKKITIIVRKTISDDITMEQCYFKSKEDKKRNNIIFKCINKELDSLIFSEIDKCWTAENKLNEEELEIKKFSELVNNFEAQLYKVRDILVNKGDELEDSYKGELEKIDKHLDLIYEYDNYNIVDTYYDMYLKLEKKINM